MRLARLAVTLVATPLFSLGAQQVAFAANAPAELDSATSAAVSREIARARERGIPVEPLIAKVREGRLKHAQGPLIRNAVSRLAERLDSARVALGTTSSSDELVAGAEALRAGAGLPALASVRGATTRSVAVPLGTLAQLLTSGVAPRRAVDMVMTLLRKNAAPGSVLALGNQVEADVASGMRGTEAAIIRLRGIEGSLGFGDKVELTSAAPGTPNAVPGGTRPGQPKRRP